MFAAFFYRTATDDYRCIEKEVMNQFHLQNNENRSLCSKEQNNTQQYLKNLRL